MEEKKTNTKRREFLTLAAVAGAGLLAGTGVNKVVSDLNKRTIRLMTPSGELVDVEVRHIKRLLKEKKISNADLKKWMEEGKQNL